MMKNFVMVTVGVLLPLVAHADDSCANYPLPGMSAFEINPDTGSLRIISTGSAAVDFDDVRAINDAREEAEIDAKRYISQSLKDPVVTKTAIQRAVDTNRTLTTDDEKNKVRQELTQKVTELSSSSAAILRGSIPIGSCYTKSREFRVTYALTSATIGAAGAAAGEMGESLLKKPTPSESSLKQGAAQVQAAPATAAPRSGEGPSATEKSGTLRGLDGFSDTSRLSKF